MLVQGRGAALCEADDPPGPPDEAAVVAQGREQGRAQGAGQAGARPAALALLAAGVIEGGQHGFASRAAVALAGATAAAAFIRPSRPR